MNVAVLIVAALALVGAGPDRQGTIAVLAVTGSAPASIRQELTSELRIAGASGLPYVHAVQVHAGAATITSHGVSRQNRKRDSVGDVPV